MSSDAQLSEVANVDSPKAAVEQFLSYDWSPAFKKWDELYADGAVCGAPDLTFSALPSHLIAAATSEEEFDVEVCLPRERKLFGLFTPAKFYTFKHVSRARAGEMIATFCEEDLARKHSYFRSLAAERRAG